MLESNRRARGEGGGSGLPTETHEEWVESLAARARRDYSEQREALGEGKPAVIRLEGKLLVLIPRHPGHPAPESGDVPVVEALLATIIDFRIAMHPDQSVELLVREVLGQNRRG